MKTLRLCIALIISLYIGVASAQDNGETSAKPEEEIIPGKPINPDMVAITIMIHEDSGEVYSIIPFEEFQENKDKISEDYAESRPYFGMLTKEFKYNLEGLEFEPRSIITLYVRKDSGEAHAIEESPVPVEMLITKDMFLEKEEVVIGNSKAKVNLEKEGEVSLIFF